MNDHQHAFDRRHSSDSGSALVAIIVTMVVISALTVAVVSLNSSGVMNTVTFNHNKNAYYLAESGYRYAAAVYLNTENDDSGGSADDEKASALARQIDGTTYTLPGGRFELSAFPYWLVPNARYTRGQTATLNFPGTIPPSFSIPSSGTMAFSHIREDGTPEITLFIYSGASINSGTNTLRCTLGNRLPTNAAYAIEADDMVYLALPPSTDQRVSTGGSLRLTLNSNMQCITTHNGIFIKGTDGGKEYLYDKAVFGTGTVTLQNITRVDGNSFNDERFRTSDYTYPVFKKNLILSSKGVAGSGNTASVRTVAYNIPISDSAREAQDINITFNSETDLRNNFSPMGNGNNAEGMEVGRYQTQGGTAYFASMTSIRADHDGAKLGHFLLNRGADIDTIWKANDRILNYDVQLKLSHGTYLLHGGSGLSFRMRTQGGSNPQYEYLAVSLMKFHVPSLVFAIDNGARDLNLSNGTLSAKTNPPWGADSRPVFSGVRCLGDDEQNAYFYPTGSNSVSRVSDGNFRRVAVHPDDFGRVLGAGPNARTLYLYFFDSGGREHYLGIMSYPHATEGYWNTAGGFGPWWDRYSFGPYKWTNYSDLIPDGLKPLVGSKRFGSMGDWWGSGNNPPIYYYNFYRRDWNGIENYSPYSIFDRLVLVLWQHQGKQGNQEIRRWLAAKDVTHDQYIRGIQGWWDGRIVNDNTTLLLRVREGRVEGIKTNFINVFYGDMSDQDTFRRPNTIAYDMMNTRQRYRLGLPTESGRWTPLWPPRSLAGWSAEKDYFTHIQEVPQGQTYAHPCQWDILNPDVDMDIFQLEDDGTILVSELTTPDSGNYQQAEIGFHSFGDVNKDNTTYGFRVASMTDFALRLTSPGHAAGGFLAARQK